MSKTGNTVVAVVVTYNRKELLKTTIECLLNQRDVKCDVLIINNASTDGTEAMISGEFSLDSIVYYNTGSNLGGAGGFEYGIGKAVELGYEFVWIMDDDTWPNGDALSQLFKADKELGGNWGFLSSAVYWTDGSICKANRPKKSIFSFVKDEEFTKNIIKIEMGSFVSLLVKAEVIKKIGLPHGEYFIWTDDYEYCGRISREYDGFLVPESKVIHAMKNHTKARIADDDISRIGRYKCLFRNDVHCYRQYGAIGWLYIISKDLYTVVDILRKSKKDKIKKISVVLKSILEGLKFDPEIKMPKVMK